MITGDLKPTNQDSSSSPNLSLSVINSDGFGPCKKNIEAKIGSVIFVAAGAHIEIISENEEVSFTLFRAHVNLGS